MNWILGIVLLESSDYLMKARSEHMKSIAWVTDSTCTIDPAFAEANHIYIVPLRLIFGDEAYKETIDISPEEVYDKLSKVDRAGSSQPPIGEFVELYESLKDKYDEIIAIHCSSELSGTYNTSMQAAVMAEVEVVGIDSQVGAYPLREMIKQGVAWQQEGFSAQQIKEKMQGIIESVSFYLMPTSLQQLHRSGRVSSTQLLLSNLLKIHLLLRFERGKVVVHEKIRTFKKARTKMVDHLNQDLDKIKEVCIMHANNLKEANEIKQLIKELDSRIHIEMMTFIPVVGILCGEGTLAMAWIKR